MLPAQLLVEAGLEAAEVVVAAARDGHGAGLVAARVDLDLILEGVVVDVVCSSPPEFPSAFFFSFFSFSFSASDGCCWLPRETRRESDGKGNEGTYVCSTPEQTPARAFGRISWV